MKIQVFVLYLCLYSLCTYQGLKVSSDWLLFRRRQGGGREEEGAARGKAQAPPPASPPPLASASGRSPPLLTSWPWPACSGTRSWPACRWGRGCGPPPASPGLRGSSSPGTSLPAWPAVRLWREVRGLLSALSFLREQPSLGSSGGGW